MKRNLRRTLALLMAFAMVFLGLSALPREAKADEPDQVTITYHLNDGSETTEQRSYDRGTEIDWDFPWWNRSGDMDHYFRSGFTTNADGSGDFFTAWPQMSEGGNWIGWFSPQEDMDLWSKWDPAYTVTFYLNDGTDAHDVWKVVEGDTLEKQGYPHFERDHQILTGFTDNPDGSGNWYTVDDRAINYIGNLRPEGDTVLYAQWEGGYEITIDAGEGDYFEWWDEEQGQDVRSQTTTMMVREGQPVWDAGVPFPQSRDAKEYGMVLYFDEGRENEVDGRFVPEGDMTLYAGYCARVYVTYHANDGSGAEETRDYDEGRRIGWDWPYFDHCEDPDHNLMVGLNTQADGDGTWYSCWGGDEDPSWIGNLVPEDGLDLYGVWEAAWTLTFDANDGTGRTDSWQNAQGDVMHDYAGFDPLPHTYLVSYNTKPDGSGEYIALNEEDEQGTYFRDYIPKGDTTFYAQWADAWEITIDAGEGDYFEWWDDGLQRDVRSQTTTMMVPKGGRVWEAGVPFPQSRDNDEYTMDLFFDEDREDLVDHEFVPEEDMTLYAGYRGKVHVTYHANDGSGAEEVYSYPAGERIGGARPYFEHYEDPDHMLLVGMNTEPDDTGTWYSYWGDDEDPSWIENLVPEDGLELYGVWAEAWNIRFDANDGSGRTISWLSAKGEHLYDFAQFDPAPHKVLDSYNTKADGTGLNLLLNEWEEGEGIYIQEFYPEEDMTLYAQWADAYMITIDAGEGDYFQWWDEEQERDVRSQTITLPLKEGWVLGDLDIPFPESRDEREYCMVLYTDPELTEEADLDEAPEGDCTYYAGYEDNLHVMLYYNNGTGDYEDLSFRPGESLERFPVRHFTFDDYGNIVSKMIGVNTESDGSGDYYSFNHDEDNYIGNLMAEDGMEFYGCWVPAYKVTFEANDGSHRTDFTVIGEGEQLGHDYTMWEHAQDPHKVIKGYSTEPSGGTLYAVMPWSDAWVGYFTTDEDATLYAQWAEGWILTLDAGDEYYSWWDEEQQKEIRSHTMDYRIPKGSSLDRADLPWPDIDGEMYRMHCYFDEARTEEIDWSYVPEGDMTIYLAFTEAVRVNYHANDGSGTVVDQYYDRDEPIDWSFVRFDHAEDPEHLVMVSYNTRPDGSGEDYSLRDRDENWVGRLVAADVPDLYAQWTEGAQITYCDTLSERWEKYSYPLGTRVEGNYHEFDYPSWNPDVPDEPMALVGYNTEPDGSGTMYWIIDGRVGGQRLEDLVVEGPMTLYAQWEEACQITVDAGEGNYYTIWPEGIRSQTKTVAVPIGAEFWMVRMPWPDNISGDEYEMSMYLDEERILPVEPEFVLDHDMTLYAGFEEKVVIRYYLNDGSEYYVDEEFIEGSPIGWDSPMLIHNFDEHLAVVGFNTKADGTGEAYSVNAEDENWIGNLTAEEGMVFYAQWGHAWAIRHVCVDENGFFEGWQGQQLQEKTASVPDGMVLGDFRWYLEPKENRAGDYFTRYYMDPECTEEIWYDFVPEEDMTIYCRGEWAWFITIYANDGTTPATETDDHLALVHTWQSQDTGEMLVNLWEYYQDPEHWLEGLTLTGYSTQEDGGGTWYSADPEDENFIGTAKFNDYTELYCQWENAETWAVTYVVNDGHSGALTYNVPKGQSIGARFWTCEEGSMASGRLQALVAYNTEQDGSGDSYHIGTGTKYGSKYVGEIVPEGDMTLYGQWVDANEITFEAPEGYYFRIWDYELEDWSDVQTKTLAVPAGSSIDEINPPVPHNVDDMEHNVVQLFLDPDREEPADGTYVPEGNMTIYEKVCPAYLITFDHNDGTEWPSTRSVVQGEAIGEDYPAGMQYKYGEEEGWALGGFNTKADGTGEAYSLDIANESWIGYVVPQDDTTFYAQWVPGYTVTLVAVGEHDFFPGMGRLEKEFKTTAPEGTSFGAFCEYLITDEQGEGDYYTHFYLDPACTQEIFWEYVPEENMTVYCRGEWVWRVTVYANDGTTPETATDDHWYSATSWQGSDTGEWTTDVWQYYQDPEHWLAGLTLTGYNTEPNGSGTGYSAQVGEENYLGTARFAENTELYCQWEIGETADYTAVDAALAKVPKDLNKYTAETAAAVTEAVNAVVRGLPAADQAEVDAMAKAIEDAVNGLIPSDLVEAFVTRLYRVCLGRTPDAAGLAGWVQQLKSGKITGVKAAQGFIFSQEFKNKNYCNKHFVQAMYQAFMGREPDAGGWADWIGRLEKGQTREQVFNGFALSPEFTKLCSDYGIARGGAIGVGKFGTVPTGPCQWPGCGEEDGVTAFVKRLYRICLNREADEGGLANWTQALWDHSKTGKQVAFGFVFSAEFTNLNLSNREFVDAMYAAFFDRPADAAGRAGWVRQLNSGKSRLSVFNGFADSQEFTNLCAKFGIVAR